MNWTEQAQEMLNTWTETQKKVWEGWYDLASKGPGGPGVPPMANPLDWLRQGMSAWTGETGPTGKGVVGNIFFSQAAMMRSMELLTKAWESIAPKVEAGEAWKPDLKSFMDQWTQEVMGLPGHGAEASKDLTELWRSFSGEWGQLMKPWMAGVGQLAQGHLGGMMLGGTEGLSRLLNLEEEIEPAFEALSEIPGIGITRDHNAKILRTFDAYVDLRKAQAKFQAKLAEGVGKAVENTMEQLAQMGSEGKKIQHVRDLMRLWVNVADKTFTDMYSTQEYHQVQKEMSAAGMKYRIAQHEVIEMIMKNLNMPTRKELDDAYRTIYQLKKDVRQLKKALQGGGQAAAKASEKSSAKKKAAKTAAKSA